MGVEHLCPLSICILSQCYQWKHLLSKMALRWEIQLWAICLCDMSDLDGTVLMNAEQQKLDGEDLMANIVVNWEMKHN